MIRAKTSIKLLRRLGFALLFAPELITTLFGAALILAARYLSRRHETRLNDRICEIVECYSACGLSSPGKVNHRSSTIASVGRRAYCPDYPLFQQGTPTLSSGTNIAPSVWQAWQAMRRRTIHPAQNTFKSMSTFACAPAKSENVIYHPGNKQPLPLGYEQPSYTRAYYNRTGLFASQRRTLYQLLERDLPLQRYGTPRAEQPTVQHHALNMPLLLQRYGSTAYGMTSKATQRNNYYYSVVSRGNIIGA